MNSAITTLDLIIIIAYFAIVLFLGYWVSKSTKTGDDLFLGSRSLGWGLIGLSLFASNISSSSIIGLSGAAYATGIVDSVYEWMSGIPLILAAVIFVPIYINNRVSTTPEFLLKRYDKRSQLFFSSVTIFGSVFIEMAGTLYAGTLVLQTFFPDLKNLIIDLNGIIIDPTGLMLAAVAAFYTASGGLKAVVLTDALQAIILIVGCSILAVILFGKLDFNWEKVVVSAPEGHLSIVRPLDDEAIPWLGLFIGVPILGFWYWTTNQYIVQRILGAKDIRHARRGVILAGFLKIIPLFIMVFPGVMAISLFPNVENKDMIFPILVTEVLPAGAVGIVLAGLISAILSSVDSALNSASTLVVLDFIKPRNPNISDQRVLKIGRFATIILITIAAIWSPQIGNFSGLWQYLQQTFAIIVPPVFVLFLIGVFYKQGNANGAFASLILGTIAGIITYILGRLGLWELHYTLNIGLMVLWSALVFVLVSYFYPEAKTHSQSAYFIFRKPMIMDGFINTKWYKHYIFQLIILLIIMTLIFLWLR